MTMRHILSLVRRCVKDFDMIKEGDKIAVGVSGGKDSLLTLRALAELRGFYPEKYELSAISLDMGFGGADYGEIEKMCAGLDVPLKVIKTNIKEVVFDIRNEKNPCSLCAKLRRGSLYSAASEDSVNKVALGHNKDDAIETFFLSLVFEGRLYSFLPVTYLSRKDITMIRPLLYVEEAEIRRTVKRLGLPVMHNPCPANENTKRQEAKELLLNMEKDYPGFRERIFGAINRLPLPGWEKPE